MASLSPETRHGLTKSLFKPALLCFICFSFRRLCCGPRLFCCGKRLLATECAMAGSRTKTSQEVHRDVCLEDCSSIDCVSFAVKPCDLSFFFPLKHVICGRVAQAVSLVLVPITQLHNKSVSAHVFQCVSDALFVVISTSPSLI